MSTDSAELQPAKWVVYTRLDQYGYHTREWFTERSFATFDDAEAFLSGPAHDWQNSPSRLDTGWRGPIKVALRDGSGDPFLGPWLREALKVDDIDATETFEQMFNAEWDATAADVIPDVMEEMASKGRLEGTDALTKEDLKKVLQAAEEHELPEIECSLDASWHFFKIAKDAKRRLGHMNPDRATGYERRLFAAALDVEDALRACWSTLTAMDVRNFWTSLQVWVHLAAFCRDTLWNVSADERRIEMARWRFCRLLGSYAHSIHSKEPAPTPTKDSKFRKKRGRPTMIPDERKRKALTVKGGKARAQILYDTKHPTAKQIKNVSTILRHFQRTRQKSE